MALFTIFAVAVDCGDVGDPCRSAALLKAEQTLALVALAPLLFLVIAIFTDRRRRILAGLTLTMALYLVWGAIWAIAFR